MNKIKKAFEHGKAFIAFITCGDPDLAVTASAVKAAVSSGADLIELGIPFSDPTAEGSALQEASLRALRGGITTDKFFTFVKELRREVTVPIVCMTYANIPFSYGTERFLSMCQEAEIDGLILPDLPFEEKEEFLPACRRYGVSLLSLVAPAPKNRIAMIAKEAEGFLYIVSSPETRIQEESDADLAAVIKVVREHSDLPCVTVCNSYAPEQAKKLADIADGVVADSGIVKLLEQYGKDAPQHIGEYVRSMKAALSADEHSS